MIIDYFLIYILLHQFIIIYKTYQIKMGLSPNKAIEFKNEKYLILVNLIESISAIYDSQTLYSKFKGIKIFLQVNHIFYLEVVIENWVTLQQFTNIKSSHFNQFLFWNRTCRKDGTRGKKHIQDKLEPYRYIVRIYTSKFPKPTHTEQKVLKAIPCMFFC